MNQVKYVAKICFSALGHDLCVIFKISLNINVFSTYVCTRIPVFECILS